MPDPFSSASVRIAAAVAACPIATPTVLKNVISSSGSLYGFKTIDNLTQLNVNCCLGEIAVSGFGQPNFLQTFNKYQIGNSEATKNLIPKVEISLYKKERNDRQKMKGISADSLFYCFGFTIRQ